MISEVGGGGRGMSFCSPNFWNPCFFDPSEIVLILCLSFDFVDPADDPAEAFYTPRVCLNKNLGKFQEKGAGSNKHQANQTKKGREQKNKRQIKRKRGWIKNTGNQTKKGLPQTHEANRKKKGLPQKQSRQVQTKMICLKTNPSKSRTQRGKLNKKIG